MTNELYLNGQLADLGGETITLEWFNNLFTQIGQIKGSYSYTIALPKTMRNCKIFDMAHIPNVERIGGMPLLGGMMKAKYLKNGFDILGDATAWLQDVTEDAFEVALYFGSTGKIEDFLRGGKKLNDFEHYNTPDALTVMYDNELTDYPDDIDSLPNIFKPYYNPGVEIDDVVKNYIARLPAVRVPYYIRKIEDEIKCKFVFPENIAEKLKYLAMPLVNKKRYFSEVFFEKATLITGNYIKTNKHSTIVPAPYGRTVAPLTFANYYPKGIDGSFKIGTYSVAAHTLNISTPEKPYKTVDMPVIIPDSGSMIPGTETEGIRITGQFSISMPFSVDGDYDTTTDENGKVALPQSRCIITMHKLKQDEYNNNWNAVEDVYVLLGDLTVLSDKDTNGRNIVSVFAEGNPFSVNLESGFAYGFTLSVVIYDTGVLNNNYEYRAIKPIPFDEGTFRGGFSFEPNIKGVGNYELTPGEDTIPAKGNLPDMEQTDFLQAIFDMFAVFPIVNPRQEKDENTGYDIIETIPLKTLYDNRKLFYRNGKPVNDWTNKLISDPLGIAIEVTNSDYGQRNYFRYTEDEKVKTNADAYFDFSILADEETKDIVKLPFAPADGDIIPMYTVEKELNDEGQEVRTYTLEDTKPRIMNIVPVEIYGETKTGLSFDGLSFETLMPRYYNDYIKVLQHWRLLTATVHLNVLDLAYLDYTHPVYFRQWGRWFAIVEISTNGDTDICELKMIML